jgi:hypothetical protein
VVIYAARPRQHSGASGKGNEQNGSHSPGRPSVELFISRSNTSRDSLLVSMQGLEARRGSLFYTSISQYLLYLNCWRTAVKSCNPLLLSTQCEDVNLHEKETNPADCPHPAPPFLSLEPLPLPLTTSPSHSQYHPKRPHPEACKFAHQASTADPSLLRLASRIS